MTLKTRSVEIADITSEPDGAVDVILHRLISES